MGVKCFHSGLMDSEMADMSHARSSDTVTIRAVCAYGICAFLNELTLLSARDPHDSAGYLASSFEDIPTIFSPTSRESPVTGRVPSGAVLQESGVRHINDVFFPVELISKIVGTADAGKSEIT
eukprot:g26375.t1